MKTRCNSLLLSFAIFVNSFHLCWAQGQSLGFNEVSGKVAFLNDSGQQFATVFNTGSGKIFSLESHMVVFDRIQQELVWMALADIPKENPSDGAPVVLNTAQISLKGEFTTGPVEDASVLESGGMATFILAGPSSTAGEIAVKTLSFYTNRDQSLNALAGSEVSSMDQVVVELPSSVVALSRPQVSIMGTGPLTTITEPKTGRPMLLTWDDKNKLIHQYIIDEGAQFYFYGSLQIAQLQEANVVSLQISQERADHFQVITDQEQMTFSMIKLRVGAALRRAELLSEVANETGNIWTKNLMVLGVFNRAIDLLDEAYGNDWVTAEDILNNPEINVLDAPSTVDVSEILDGLLAENLITEEEYQEMEMNYSIESGRGWKWFGLAAIVLSIYGYRKFKPLIYDYIKKKPRLQALSGHASDGIEQKRSRAKAFLRGTMTSSGLISERMGTAKSFLKGRQHTFKRWLLRNHYNSLLPIKDIVKAEKNILKICKKVGTPEARELMEYIKTNRKLRNHRERSENLANLFDSPKFQPVYDQFLHKYVYGSPLYKFKEGLKTYVDELAQTPKGTKILSRIFAGRFYKLVEFATAPPSKKLGMHLDRLEVFERQVEVQEAIIRMRGEVLVIERKTCKPRL